MTDEGVKGVLFSLLNEELELLDKAAEILSYSYEKCKEIGIKDGYDYDELDRFESLINRFVRLSDFLVLRIFRLIDQVELEPEGSVRDRINRAEKKGLIESADDFVTIRILRNQIAHEYVPAEIQDMFKKVFNYTPILLGSVQRVKTYTDKFKTDTPDAAAQ